MTDIETAVRRQIALIARPFEVDPANIDMDSGLKQEFGISSMKLVLLMTALCREFGISLSSFDEQDLAGLNTGADLIKIFGKAPAGSNA